MSQVPHELLEQLANLVDQLRAESADYQQAHDDTQQWYNRGYANGMVRALGELLDDATPMGLTVDEQEALKGHEVMAWGQAYRHGESMGHKETYEIVSQ